MPSTADIVWVGGVIEGEVVLAKQFWELSTVRSEDTNCAKLHFPPPPQERLLV